MNWYYLVKKTATTSNYDKSDLPVIGEETIIQFNNENEACIVKTVSYKVMKFNEMTEELARLEGEGDLSLEYWRKVLSHIILILMMKL